MIKRLHLEKSFQTILLIETLVNIGKYIGKLTGETHRNILLFNYISLLFQMRFCVEGNYASKHKSKLKAFVCAT